MIVTLVMIVVITLIVVSFTQVATRNQREAGDQQQATQAYYAAETGVNDAARIVKTAYETTGSVTAKSDCAPNSTYTSARATLSSGVSYSCLLVNPSPTTLLYKSVAPDSSSVAPITVNNNLTDLKISWNPDGTDTNIANCGNVLSDVLQMPTSGSWNCEYGIMRVDLVQLGTSYSASGLDDRTLTFYLKPGTTTQTLAVSSFTAAPRAYVRYANCVSKTCTSTIQLSGAASTRQYYVRLTSLYRTAKDVVIAGKATGTTVTFTGAQVVIDATGKAQDQLRRISVRVPLRNGNEIGYPSKALQSTGNICKRYITGYGIELTDPSDLCNPAGVKFSAACTTTTRDIALVLDWSSSMSNTWVTTTRLDQQKRLANYIVDNLNLSETANKVSVIRFSRTSTLAQGLTTNVGSLHSAINSSAGLSGYTWYSTALQTAQSSLAGSGSRSGAKKYVLFVSDGRPNDKGESTEAEKTATYNAVMLETNKMIAAGYDVTTVAIILDTDESRALQDMAIGEGMFFSASSEDQMSIAMTEIVNQIGC